MEEVMTRSERDELRRLAQEATVGPWEAAECGGHLVMAGPLSINRLGYLKGGRGQVAEMDDERSEDEQQANAAFIAAANPAAVLALLGALDAAERTPAESSSS